MAHPVQPSDADFEQAVTAVLQQRLAEIREHFAAMLKRAGFVDAAAWLRDQHDEETGEKP